MNTIMKTKALFLFLFVLYLPVSMQAQTMHRQISDLDFVFKSETLNDCPDVECKQLNIYRNGKIVLSMPLLRKTVNSNGESYEIGNYKVDNEHIYLYTMWVYWSKSNDWPYKYGFKKLVYKVISNEDIDLISSEIIVEDAFRQLATNNTYFNESEPYVHQGVNYVFKKPKTAYENAALEDYIKMIEKEYNSKFITGKNQWRLEREVRLAVKKTHHEKTKEWDPKNKEKYGLVRK